MSWIEYVSKNIREKDILSYLPKETYFTAVDSESYELGYVSSVLLDRLKLAWKKTCLKGKLTPAELLLKDIKVVSDSENPQIKKKVVQTIDEVSQNTKKAINNVIEAEANNQISYLKIKEKYMNGSFGGEGFYNYHNREITSNMSCTFKMRDRELNLNGLSVISLEENKENYIVIPLQTQFVYKDNILTFKSGAITGSVKVNIEKDKNGRTWYITE